MNLLLVAVKKVLKVIFPICEYHVAAVVWFWNLKTYQRWLSSPKDCVRKLETIKIWQ